MCNPQFNPLRLDPLDIMGRRQAKHQLKQANAQRQADIDAANRETLRRAPVGSLLTSTGTFKGVPTQGRQTSLLTGNPDNSLLG